jgi:hypothetical protein
MGPTAEQLICRTTSANLEEGVLCVPHISLQSDAIMVTRRCYTNHWQRDTVQNNLSNRPTRPTANR